MRAGLKTQDLVHDPELAAALIALSRISGGRGLAAVDVHRREIHFDRLDKLGLSSGEVLMVNVARALWHGSGAVDLGRLAALDDAWLGTVLAALSARRGQVDTQRLRMATEHLPTGYEVGT